MRSESLNSQAFTASAPRDRSSSAAISAHGTFPAIDFSLAMSSSVHARFEWGIHSQLPAKNPKSQTFLRFLAVSRQDKALRSDQQGFHNVSTKRERKVRSQVVILARD